jgi:GTP 3',8-cyclase
MASLANDKLRLIVTGKCNLSCFYCHNEGQAKEETFLSEELFERVLSAVRTDGLTVREVTISGGEPMLHPQLTHFVSQARELASDVTAVSNGLLVDDELVGRLSSAGLTKLRLGVDSLAPRKPRPSPGKLLEPFDAAALVAGLRAAGVGADLNCVLTRFNRRGIADLVAFAIEQELDVKFFEHVDVHQHGAEAVVGQMTAHPHIAWEDFLGEAERGAGHPLRFAPTESFGQANLASGDAGPEIRYCRYLCPFGLCWITGTRIDPRGFVYNCMVNRGLDRIDASMDNAAVLEVLDRAGRRPCRATQRQVA